MNTTSQFFILDVKPTVKEQETAQTNTNSPYNLETPLTRPKLPSKFIKKWSEYADDTVVQKSVSAVNGDLSFSLPIVQVNLTPFLKIDIDLVYMVGKNGIEFEVPLTKSFISIDHQKSIFRNDAIFLLNSMGSKMTLESVGTNRFKMLEDVKGEVDVTYYPDQEYFTVESALEKLVYGKFGDTGTVLYELSYRHWRETGNDPQSLIRIPVAWYLAERHSKSDDRVIYYRYETVDVPHQLNPQVSYTSEVMLKSIDDGNDMKVQFEYGLKESSENEEMKLKNDDGNLRMGNFIVEKHFLNRIKVETETYEQDFGLTYELFDGKTRVPVALTQVMADNKVEKVLRFKIQKISGNYFPSHIGVFHGVTTKFTYESQVVPSPQLEKKFILKNRPVISYGSNVIAFSSIIDNRVVLKIFKIKTFKLQKEISIIDKNSIDITSLQVGFSENFMIVTYKTNDERNLSIYYQNGRENWHDNPTIRKFSKDSKVYMTGRDFAIVHDQLTLTVLQKKWNENALMIQSFYTRDENMKVIIKGKSIFLRENSNLHVVFKGDDGEWKMKLLKNDISSSAVRIASLFDVNDDVRKAIQRPLEENEIRVMNNIVILSNLIFRPNKQFRTVFTFITVNDNYDVKSEEELWEDREIISDLVTTFPIDGTNLTVKYQKSGNNYVLRVVDFDGAAAKQIEAMPNKNQRFIERLNFINSWNKNDKFIQHMKSQFLLKWNKYYPIQENGKNDLYFSEDIQFRMTGTKWTKDEIASQRTVQLGDKFKLIFNSENPNNVELIGQSEEDYKLNLFLKHPQMLINMYPQYIAYQPDTGITKLIVFEDGQKVVAHVTFNNEDLMFESNQGYFITIKKSLDLSHSEPYELIVRNMAQYLTDKSQVVVKMTEMWKNMKDYPNLSLTHLIPTRES